MLGSVCVRVRIRAKRVSTTVRLSVCVRVRVIDYREAGKACACVAVELEPMFAVEAKKRQARKAADSVVANMPQQKPDRSRDQAADVVNG